MENRGGRAFCRIIGVRRIGGIAFGFPRRRVSRARSVISDGAAAPSHPGRRADGLMCGEMSREQSLAPSLPACLPLPASPSSHYLPPSPRGGCVLGLRWLGGKPRRNELTETPKAHLKLVLLENLPVHAPLRRWRAHSGEAGLFWWSVSSWQPQRWNTCAASAFASCLRPHRPDRLITGSSLSKNVWTTDLQSS